MKKIGIILSVFIITGVFIYTMSLISLRNTCTGVRIYECTALQKKQAADQSALLQQIAQEQLVKQQKYLQAQQQLQQTLQAPQIVTTPPKPVQQKTPVVIQPKPVQPTVPVAIQPAPVQQQPTAPVINTTTRAS